MTRTHRIPGFAAAAFGLIVAGASAGQTWTFDVTTTGQDVSWTSPTSVDPTASVYATSYQITLVEVDVTWLGIPFNNINVTSQIPPELQSAAFDVPGPAPVALVNQPVVVPSPPEPPAFAGTLSFGLNAGGSGYATATNVTLGTMAINLGGIFGTQTVTLKSVRLAGQLSIHGAWYDLGNGKPGSTGTPAFTGAGPLSAGQPLTLTLAGAAPLVNSVLIVGLSQVNLPFAGGILVPAPSVLLFIPTDVAGGFALPAVWPAGIPANTSLYMQCWVLTPAGTAVDAASNALRAVAQ